VAPRGGPSADDLWNGIDRFEVLLIKLVKGCLLLVMCIHLCLKEIVRVFGGCGTHKDPITGSPWHPNLSGPLTRGFAIAQACHFWSNLMIQRHKTAIHRTGLSRPMRLALRGDCSPPRDRR
jgi:hypothetical protein